MAAARQAGELWAARLGQSACTPPDNWPISGREVRGPERIILGKAAEAGDCCGERRASSRCVRPPASPRSEPGLGGLTLPAQLRAEEAESSSFSEV